MANGVVFLPSYHEAIRDLPDSDRLQMYEAIVRYGLYGEVIELSGVTKALFTLIKPNIDSSQNRYRASKENGKKPPKEGSNPRGRPRKNQTENQNENQTENQDKDIDKDSDFDSDMDSDRDRIRPTLEEVKLFAFENDMKADPERFFNYYSARGWKVRNNSITDWKALFRAWDAREPEKPKEQEWNIHYANIECAAEPEREWNVHYD